MKKGSDWSNTYKTLRLNKDIRRLHKKIVEKVTKHQSYIDKYGTVGGLQFSANDIIHYILNYYDIKRK